MKKTLVALAVTAFATSASAVTVYDQDGSKVEFHGSIRLLLDNGYGNENGNRHGKSKVKETEISKLTGKITKESDLPGKERHTNLHNDGSRFGVKVKHNLADDFYALGRVEFRFKDDKSGNTDEFGGLYAQRAYVGFGSKEFGELTFGRQLLIGDDIAQAGFDYQYGVFDGTLAASSNSTIRYDYKGLDNAIFSLDYRFADKRGEDNNVVLDKDPKEDGNQPGLKSGYDVGAIYNFTLAENQSATVAAGYSRDNYVTGTNKKNHKDAYQFGASYTVDTLTLAGDYAGSFQKYGDGKESFNGFRVGVSYAVTPKIDVYGNYGYGVKKDKEFDWNRKTGKISAHRYMLGSVYRLTKNVLTYVEVGISKHKEDILKDKDKDTLIHTKGTTTGKNIGVGLRVSW